MTWDAALVNTIGFVLGVLTWLPFTVWQTRREPQTKESDMAETGDRGKTGERGLKGPRGFQGPRGKGPTPGALVLILLLAAAVLVGFGFQQGSFQRTSDERDTCYSEWGAGVIDTIDTRTAAVSRLEKAREARDDALDSIALLALTLGDENPPPTEREANTRFRRVLLIFANAKAKLDRVSDTVVRTRRENPYPVLDCTDGTEDGTDEDTK